MKTSPHMASQFREKVAMDLLQWNGWWILHIIDLVKVHDFSFHFKEKSM